MATPAGKVLSVNVGSVREYEYALPGVLSGNHLPSVGSPPEVSISRETTRQIGRPMGDPIKLPMHTQSKTHDGGNRRSGERLPTVSLAKISPRKGLT